MDHNTSDFINAVTNPKRCYGEVPFYWWNGDKLDKNRITSQLESLSDKGIAGVQVNYAHLNGGGENNISHGGFGRSIPGQPYQFSEEWWEFFCHAAKECERLGMSIGVGDYTIAWIGNGFFTDTVAAAKNMHAVNLTCEKKMLFSGDEQHTDSDVLAIIMYTDSECTEPVLIYTESEGVISPVPGCAECYIVKKHETENSINPLNPDCGKMLVDIYFKEFERRLPNLRPGTLNYFFQDELMFGTDIKTLWSSSLRDAVKAKYGYDILGFIPHLFYNLSSITAKIRLDIADVRTSLIEESYFKPIYNYHASRNMIYGCDQSGRGKNPAEFSDYFRTVRWFTAPGNDTPGRAADLIKVKVNSSISHLYKRPRVWLEGYHSSGWGTTLESITDATSDNFIFGANLLNLHGLYYSTHGGFFEWAPPDFHFRMPYWDDEKSWLDRYKRLSALLTTGHHECDAAVFYPVSSFDYGENSTECIDLTFRCAEYLFNHGVDFDFIDFQSIENSICSDGRLKTADEKYKILIFAGVDCIRYSVIEKLKAFLDCGGVVAFCGLTPYISNRKGSDDEVFNNDILDILSHPNCTLAASETELLTYINIKITRSFLPENLYSDDKVYVHKRIHGKDKLFYVRYAEKDSVCRFEATGAPYLLNIDKGEVIRLKGTICQEGFTFIKMPLAKNSDSLILFTEKNPLIDGEINTSGFLSDTVKKEILLDGDWDFSINPTLNNKYGDFYLPESEFIGAEARFFDCVRTDNINEIPDKYKYLSLPYCHSQSIKKISCECNPVELCRFISENSSELIKSKIIYNNYEYDIVIPELHDRYGYICTDNFETSLYEQGWHGLKEKVYDDNIYFSRNSVYFTYINSNTQTEAFIHTGSIKPDILLLNGKEIKTKKINLIKGKNLLCFAYTYNPDTVPDFRNSSEIKRTSLYITKKTDITKCDYPLSISAFGNPDFYHFSSENNNNDIFCFRFKTVPGFYKFECNIFGKLLVAYNNKKPMKINFKGDGNFGGKVYTAEADNSDEHISEVILFIKNDADIEYTGVIPEPVKLFCNKGKFHCCDTSVYGGALKNYSGKFIYEKDIMIEKIFTDERFYLDIADAGATLNIEINGRTADVLTFRPFTCDITDYLLNGMNHIKITVSNTLCNHYSTIPSRYSNFPEDAKSGLIGPVKIRITEN